MKGYDMSPRKMMAGGNDSGSFGVDKIPEVKHPEIDPDDGVHGRVMTDRERGMPHKGDDDFHRQTSPDHGPISHMDDKPMSRERRPHHIKGR